MVNSIRNKLLSIVLNDEYIKDVKEYVNTFREVTTLQNKYWKSIEPTYKPRKILKEIRKQAIEDTVNSLTEGGIGVNIADEITGILRANITSGGSYKKLEKELRSRIVDDELLRRYTMQTTKDALNQYSGQVLQLTSADLGAEWFQFQGTEIKTSRPICQAMHDENLYFHISQIPKLLKGQWADGTQMTYTDINTGTLSTVEINPKTNLPMGMIKGTNPSNYFTYRNGYQCGHQFRPVLREAVVPVKFKNLVYSTPEYKAWAKLNGKEPNDPKQVKEKELQVNKEYKNNFIDKSISISDADLDSVQKVQNTLQIENTRLKRGLLDWVADSARVRDLPDDNETKIGILKAVSRPTEYNEVYRGESYSRNRTEEINASDYLIKKVYKKGAVIDFSKGLDINGRTYDNRMISATTSNDVADLFGNKQDSSYKTIKYIYKSQDGNTIHGMDLSKSVNKKEKEVIVGNGFKYKVVDNYDDENGDTIIILEQIL